MVAWCHGAAGIGFARLESQKYIEDASLGGEIEAALETTLEQGFGSNHCLCHGDLGNLEFVQTASKHLPQYQEAAEQLTAMLVDSIDRQGWVTGVPMGVETPGLMIGITGTGYELLRLAAPDRIPSVLLSTPPPDAKPDSSSSVD